MVRPNKKHDFEDFITSFGYFTFMALVLLSLLLLWGIILYGAYKGLEWLIA